MNSAEKVQYHFALVLLADDESSVRKYYEQHRNLLAQKELQTIFLERSSESEIKRAADDEISSLGNVSCWLIPYDYTVDDAYNASLDLISADYGMLFKYRCLL